MYDTNLHELKKYEMRDGNFRLYKYRLSFDSIRLEELRKQIIEKCSEIIPRDYYSPSPMDDLDPLFVRNYSEEQLPSGEYHYKYDLYVEPKLSNLIKLILVGNLSAYKEIKSMYHERKLQKPNMQNSKLEKAKNFYTKQSNSQFVEKETEDFCILAEYLYKNKDRISEYDYCQDVYKSFRQVVVDIVPLEDENIMRILSLFEGISLDNIQIILNDLFSEQEKQYVKKEQKKD